ncbi:MAG TPA: hypothetical protein PLS29_09980, partial [Acidimicrobiales bacterium]|nr:hypothetical protein [Acidimicrobiales bacterium]
ARPGRRRLGEGAQVLVATLVALVVLGGGVFIYVIHEHASLPCTVSYVAVPSLGASHLNRSGPLRRLPPSRDNDAARSRVPDPTPDADNDVVRRTLICR